MELRRGHFGKAVQILMPVLPYERAAGFDAMFLRGQAYLGLGDGKSAAVEFEKIVNNRGLDSLSVFYPLAYLNLGRAAKLLGDIPRSRKAYQDFFALWNDADPDLPVCIEAKAEYEKLR